ncbi:SlyX family protein [Thiovibrio sp. JS02]
MENRIIELETRLAFQEMTIEELNDALTAQQSQLDNMRKEFEKMKNLLAKIIPLLDSGE